MSEAFCDLTQLFPPYLFLPSLGLSKATSHCPRPTSQVPLSPCSHILACPAFSTHHPLTKCPGHPLTEAQLSHPPQKASPEHATHPRLPGLSTSTGPTRTGLRVHLGLDQDSALHTRNLRCSEWAILSSVRLRWKLELGLKPSSAAQPVLCPSSPTPTSPQPGPQISVAES